MRKETPYTPVTDAIWMIGNMRNCELPRKFHGNPERNQPRTISSPTQPAPHSKAQIARVKALLSIIAPSPGATRQQSQTHAPMKSAQYALKASQPRPGASGIPRNV